MTFDELLKQMKEDIKADLTPNDSTEKIARVTALDKNLDELKNEHEKLVKENSELKDKLIEQIKYSGNTDAPKGDSDKPVTFEELANDIIAKRK